MKFDLTKILVAAFIGLVTAAKIDLEAYNAHPDPKFDWKLALGRWVRGALVGAMTGAGIGAAGVSSA